MTQRFYGRGKLLITGEYLVLDGALALAIPTQKGQSLVVEPSLSKGITWTSLKASGENWFSTHLSYPELTKKLPKQPADPKDRLIQLLAAARSLNQSFLGANENLAITTTLEFESNWGLGSSSTLIYTLAQWAKVDPYELLKLTFGGSGYDIACAGNEKPILYQINATKPTVLQTTFDPKFKDRLFFVHLNKKQNSRDSISNYRKQPKESLESAINRISGISETLVNCEDLLSFRALIDTHERIIAAILHTQTIKKQLFADYIGSIKSLGGWGGDFVLATGSVEDQSYFRNKGYNTIIPFSEMAL